MSCRHLACGFGSHCFHTQVTEGWNSWSIIVQFHCEIEQDFWVSASEDKMLLLFVSRTI